MLSLRCGEVTFSVSWKHNHLESWIYCLKNDCTHSSEFPKFWWYFFRGLVRKYTFILQNFERACGERQNKRIRVQLTPMQWLLLWGNVCNINHNDQCSYFLPMSGTVLITLVTESTVRDMWNVSCTHTKCKASYLSVFLSFYLYTSF